MNSLKQRVWNGTINTQITFNDAEFLLAVHRNSYFPLYLPEIVRFFSNVSGLDLASANCWLEYESVPLKWNMPTGVLYDLLYLPSAPHNRTWTLNLRSTADNSQFPADDIIPYNQAASAPDYESLVSQVVINHLKQACYVTNGNSRAVLTLSEDDTRSLWHAIVNHDYGVYTAINRKILPKQTPQRIPIKVYLAGSATMVQLPVAAADEQNHPTTLHSVLASSLPQWFAHDTAKAYIHGIDVDVLYSEPVLDVWSQFRHLDNFLYIVVAAV